MGPDFTVREVVLDRDLRAPEILSASTASTGYLVRRYTSIACLVFIDIVSLCGAALVVNQVRQAGSDPLTERLPEYLAIAAAVLVAMFALHGLYGLRERRRDVSAVLRAGVWSMAVIIVFSATWGIWAPSYILSTALAAALLVHFGRELFDMLLRLLFSLDHERKRALLVASSPGSSAILDADMSHRTGARIMGVVGEIVEGVRPRKDSAPVLGSLADIEAIVRRWHPDELVVVDREVETHHLVELAELCRRRRMTLALADMEMRFSASGVSLIPGLGEALFVAAPAPRSGLAWVVKRWSDLIIAAVLLILLSPVFAAIALAIKLTSRGPVFFTAERVGLGQRTFRCYKFRTMRADAEALQGRLEIHNEADGAIFKIKDDPRVTRVGRILRPASIDELPQLFNVLRREMSLVGPRPLPLRDNELLEAWHKQRHLVLPGITGLWQVSGRSNTTFDEMIELDHEYIDNWTLWLDLTIMWRTLTAVFKRHGAY